jgi:hypothetical protein
MGLRTIGRWLYHAITSAEKRPYIELNIERLELLTAQAASSRDIILLFNVLDELTYRKSTPVRRDELAKKITSLLNEFGSINIAPNAEREKIAKTRSDYLAEADLRAAEEKRRQLSEARSKRDAEARKEAERKAQEAAAERARQEAEAKAQREEAARKEVERKAKEAAAEQARLEAEEKARLEAERKAQEAAAEKARQEAEAKAKREEKARKEAERKAKEAAAEQARLEAKEKAKQEAERKAQEAAAEKARQEAEAKAKREEKARKEAERKTKEAAAEQARLEAEEKARLEAERKAQEAAAEKARKEAERKAKEAAAEQAKREKERSAAEEKARQQAEAENKRATEEQARQAAEVERVRLAEAQVRREAEEKARREEKEEKEGQEAKAHPMVSDENNLKDLQSRQKDMAERKRLVEEARKQDLSEQIHKFLEARPIPTVAAALSDEDFAADQEARQQSEARTKLAGEEQERQSEEAEKALQEVKAKVYEQIEVGLFAAEELKAASPNDNRAVADARRDETSEILSEKLPAKTIHRSLSREEQREERRERARLRRLEREGKTENQSDEEGEGENEEYEFEEAEQFAPYLRSVPAHWSDWSEQDWNIKLLHYCFVQKAFANSSQGIPSTEEDLAFLTGDRESQPSDLAQALVSCVREYSFNHGSSPARYLSQRLEAWNYNNSRPPRFYAFLWTTCLIAQGFPSPFEQGEFHGRYERDDVFGANESQYLSGNLPAAWVQLSKWLYRNDIFDGQGHRRLVLPKTDPRRSVISHSWKLSFPCRTDRKRLKDVLERVKKDLTSFQSIDIQLISRIYHQGGFTPEFTAALKQQIDLMQKGNQTEEWLTAIIQREVKALGTSKVQTKGHGTVRAGNRSSPKIMLHLDDDDCYLELVLPSQSVAVEERWRLSHNAKYAISIEDEETQAQDIRELNRAC